MNLQLLELLLVDHFRVLRQACETCIDVLPEHVGARYPVLFSGEYRFLELDDNLFHQPRVFR